MYASEVIDTDQVSYEGQAAEEEIYTEADEVPEYTGGEKALLKFIVKNLKYPPEMARRGIQGRVLLSFIVEKDGSIMNIEVLESPAKELSEEAIRVISLMPKWKPGKIGGNPVRFKYTLPVSFKLR